MVCDCGGTELGPGIGELGVIGAIGCPPAFHTLGVNIRFPAFIFASICGSDIVVNSSHGTEGSSDGGAANSAGPTLRPVNR